MGPATAVLLCALDMLGAFARTLPPIELVKQPPEDVSSNTDGFVRSGTGVIYLVTHSVAFREAKCQNPRSLMHLASVIVHEEWHVRHGSDEKGAYEAQLYALLRLGATPDSAVYRSVRRSMREVLQERERAAATPERTLAVTAP